MCDAFVAENRFNRQKLRVNGQKYQVKAVEGVGIA